MTAPCTAVRLWLEAETALKYRGVAGVSIAMTYARPLLTSRIVFTTSSSRKFMVAMITANIRSEIGNAPETSHV